MYVIVKNKKVSMKVYDDGTFIVEPNEKYKTQFYNDLARLKEGIISKKEFEEKYGIVELKKEAVQKYREILPELEKAVNDYESFVKLIESLM